MFNQPKSEQISREQFLSQQTFDRHYRRVIENILSNSEAVILCEQDYPDHILGFLTYSLPNTVHWLYIKSVFRHQGWGNDLLRHIFPSTSEPLLCTHTGHLFKNKHTVSRYHLHYHPFSLYVGASHDQ